MYLVYTLAVALLLSNPQAAPSSQQDAQNAPASSQSSQEPPQEQKPAAAQTAPTPSKPKSPSRAHKRRSTLHQRLPDIPANPPRKIVIRHGSTPEPTAQLAPGMTQEQARHQRQNTEQLLVSTETNLQQLAGRSLNSSQQETVGQIRNYMAGARSALQGGDTQRAHTMAAKAQLLSDDLVKH
jgi:hypothetical protein